MGELELYLRMAAEDAIRLEGRLPPSVRSDRRVLLQRVPLGVAGIIVPWNWPYTMAAELFAPALAAGNTVVWLAAPTTGACSAVLASVITAGEVGLPPGALNFLNGAGPVAGDALAGHPGVDAVAFIGSIATGRSVAARAAGKAQILELGGNGPLVVLDDAELDAAVAATLEASYLCAGQSCTAGERILVHRAVRGAFVERLEAAVAAQVHLGDPFDVRHHDGAAQQRWRGGQDRRARGAGGRRRSSRGRGRRGEPTGSPPASTGSRRSSTA